MTKLLLPVLVALGVGCTGRHDAPEPCGSAAACGELLRHQLQGQRADGLVSPSEERAMVRIRGFGPEALPVIGSLLLDSNDAVREVAVVGARALGAQGRLLDQALERAVEDEIARADAAYLEVDPDRAIPFLGEDQSRGRCHARELLSSGPRGLSAFAQSLRSPRVAGCAVDELFDAVYQSGRRELLQPELVPALIAMLTNPEADKGTRFNAAFVLGEFGPRAKEAIPALRACHAADPDEEACANALAAVGDATILPLLVQRIADDHSIDGATRSLRTLRGLARAGPRAAAVVPDVAKKLRSTRRFIRWEATQTLGAIGSPAAVQALVAALTPDSWSTTEGSVRALARIGGPEVVGPISRVRDAYWYPRVRRIAAEQLERLHAPVSERPAEAEPPEPWPRDARDRCVPNPGGAFLVRAGQRELAVPPVEYRDVPTPSDFPSVSLGSKPRRRGNLQFRAFSGGWLVGRDAGEWGGGLWQVESSGKARALADDWTHVAAFLDTRLGLVAVGGIRHRGIDEGALTILRESEPGRWEVSRTIETPGEPLAWVIRVERTLLVVGTIGAMELGADGTVLSWECTHPTPKPKAQ